MNASRRARNLRFARIIDLSRYCQTFTGTLPPGLTIWKDMRRRAWKDSAYWQPRKSGNE